MIGERKDPEIREELSKELQNELFSIVKYLKDLIPTISAGSKILFKKEENNIIGYVDIESYSVTGFKISNKDDLFINWLGEEPVLIDMEEFVTLRKITKSSIVGYNMTDDIFQILIEKSNKDGDITFEGTLTFDKRIQSKKYVREMNNLQNAIRTEDRTTVFEFESDDIKDELVISIYINEDNSLTFEKTDRILLHTHFSALSIIRPGRRIILEVNEEDYNNEVTEILIKSIDSDTRYYQILNVIVI